MKTFKLVCDGKLSGDQDMEELFAAELVEMFEIFRKKQMSYGRGNIAKFGEVGVVVRVSDKTERLVRLLWKKVNNPIADETISDTWHDIGVYSVIAILCRKGKWI